MSVPAAEPQCAPDHGALADLVQAVAIRSDRAAFAVLFRHFVPKIKRYLIKSGATAAQTEELAWDVMLTIWRKASTFHRRQASASTWLFTNARNRRIAAIRPERRPEIDPASKGDLAINDARDGHRPVAESGEGCIALAVAAAPLRSTVPLGLFQRVINLGRGEA
jgi:RNA polymerase sigma-70 factor (ECF subfamily)